MTAATAMGLALLVGSGDRCLPNNRAPRPRRPLPRPARVKVCRVKLKYSGEVKTWVCKSEEPCCVWHEINYVKCGSTITGCL